MTKMADGRIALNGRWSFGAGPNSQGGHLRRVTSPGLKRPTQSQVVTMGQTKLQEKDSTLHMG